MTEAEKLAWLKQKYPKPRTIYLRDRFGEIDNTCEIHGWCIQEQWEGCSELYRCWHGKRQSQIGWPTKEAMQEMTKEEKVNWQRKNFPSRIVTFKLPTSETVSCQIWGWCIKEQFDICNSRNYCPEYFKNKPPRE